MKNWEGKLLIFLAILFSIIMLVVLVLTYDDCESRGGEVVPNGVYITTYVYSGKVMIPITSEGSECSQ